MVLTQGSLMRLARMGKGMSLTKLSDATGRSISFLSKMEHDIYEVAPEVWITLRIQDSKSFWYLNILDAIKLQDKNSDELIESLNNALSVAASPGPLKSICTSNTP